MPDEQREQMGCTGEGQTLWADMPGVGEVNTCPVNYLTPDVRECMMLHGQWTQGTLAVAGGVLDQAAAYVEAMTCLDHWVGYSRREIEEAERRKHGR